MCGNNVPAGKVVSVLNKASGDVNDLCALLARNCKPPRPAASGSASKSVKDACNNSRLPFEKPLPYQKPTPVNTQRGEVRPTHPLTGQKLPDDVMMPTSPAEYKKVQKLLGINSIMQRGRVIRGKRSNHKGVDFPFGGKPTLPIKAILKGRVLQVGHQKDSDGKTSGWGRFIILDHRPFYSLVDEQNNTEISGPLFTIYAHLEKATVRSNMTVDAGQQIAIGGNSGTSTGPHLHLEVITDATINGSPRVDPLKFFTFKLKKKSSQ